MTTAQEVAGALQEELFAAGLAPLWTQGPDLMPPEPRPRAVPHMWRWASIWPLVQRVGAEITVGEAAQRRAIALANPGLGGRPYATPTLWAAVQYLAPGETAPSHRHTQGAFRFILAGEGAATSVNGDVVAMRPGDVVLTPGWAWHEHRSLSSAPTMWLDGLDIPLVHYLDAGFQEQGGTRSTHPWEGGPSRSERLWGRPGLFPRVPDELDIARLLVYRWAETEAALASILELQQDGLPAHLHPGHAALRFQKPFDGGDPLPTMRLEMHRLLAGTTVALPRRTGSSVWQVFRGRGSVRLGDQQHEDCVFGDLLTVPSWVSMTLHADDDLDVFAYSDAPVYEALHLEAPAGTSRHI